jgi:nitrous oxidase accessory protein
VKTALLYLCALISTGWAAIVPARLSISAAIARAKPGDTILITGPRVFHEHLLINKTVRLLGTNSPVIEGGGSGTPLTIRFPNVYVRGLTIHNGGSNLGNFDSGIMLLAPAATVKDCRIQVAGFGIYLHGATGCRIENNVILGDTNLASAQRGNGIHLWNCKSNLIAGNFVRDTRDGLYFSFADSNLIASNHVERTRFGIHYMYSNGNRLEGNDLTANAAGAALMFSRDCQVVGNRAFANRRYGILLKQIDSSEFRDNLAFGQNRGLAIMQSTQNRFEANVVSQNDVGVYLSNGSEDNVFSGNAFADNTQQVWQPPDQFEAGRRASNRFSEQGRGNFWSDYTGADANGDGIGDTPYHQADAYGYILNRHPEARVFALSPAVALLRKGEELLPLLNTTGVTDLAPLMHNPTPAP